MKSGDYEVGYCKPPKETRFAKGVSGNPGGRAKGSRGLKTDLAAELEAKETIKVGGKQVTDTRQRQAMRTLCIRAANGDLKAMQQLIPLIVQVLGIEDRHTKKEQLSASDQKLLDDILDNYEIGENSMDGIELTSSDGGDVTEDRPE